MIYEATEMDFAAVPVTECSTRICALKQAYGLSVPFIRYYADGAGTLAAVMDGFCVVDCPTILTDEWLAFLPVLSDVHTVHTDIQNGNLLVKQYDLTAKSGVVMRLDRELPLLAERREQPSLRAVYTLLETIFPPFVPFDGWYVDASHRVRHGLCHIATTQDNGKPISCAMTVAESADAAIIGGVATAPSRRRLGLAQHCINDLLRQLPQKTVFISPNNTQARAYYERFGFEPCGEWAEITFD